MPLYEEWWFWALVAGAIVAAVAVEPAYRRGVARLRESALRRRIVEPGPGERVETKPGRRGSEPTLALLGIATWVALSPWIWGYDDVDGAVTSDVVTGVAIAGVSAAGAVFPALLALDVLAGMWLVTAPWLVGFGTENGLVGLSDVVAGIAVCILALQGMTEAGRRLRAARPGPIGRVRR
jgi:hypothetical protein